jgi:glycosyltransferase involved in cell wall biosynthesis
MPLTIKAEPVNDSVIVGWGADELSKNSKGGTEMMRDGLYERLPEDLRDQFQVICSRVRELDGRPAILWLHDMWSDPEAQHLTEKDSRARFEKLVFVSHWQQSTYNIGLGVPYEDGVVLRNAIDPIEYVEKKEDQIRLIYHTTPHRGLDLLVPAYDALYNIWGDKIHLDVYSSFSIYGWSQRDKPFEPLFERCRQHPGITYHGYQPNDVIREALKQAHIYSYPCIWPETSCISIIEAMSAGCAIVTSSLGAIPETTGHFATMYPYRENDNDHANAFAQVLHNQIHNIFSDDEKIKLNIQRNWANSFYNWDTRTMEWTSLLRGLQ